MKAIKLIQVKMYVYSR